MKDTEPPRIEAAALERFRARLEDGREHLNELAQSLSPTQGQELTALMTSLIDEVVVGLVQEALAAQDQLSAEPLTILAMGGYGRSELCPRSDIDLLFLLPSELSSSLQAKMEALIYAVLYGLWDLGLEVGQAVRTVEQTIEFAQEEQSILTSLLDARAIFPLPSQRFEALSGRIERQLLSGQGASTLIQQKLEEAARRRERFGGSIFLLEPNVKEGDGGLRELHTAMWISRARWRSRSLRSLLRLGVISPRETRTIERALGFLLRVRTELHLAANRRQDSLRFEFQEAIAKSLGYLAETEDPARRKIGVERFMRLYYFHAQQLKLVSGQIIERATFAPRRSVPSRAAPGGFKLWMGMLTVHDRAQFARDPSALVRIFEVAQKEGLQIYSYTKELIVHARGHLDRAARRSPEVVASFLRMLEYNRADGSILQILHDLGVLRRLIPEFARVTARWQHSLYHVYTVDVHSIIVTQLLKRLHRGDFGDEHRNLSRIMADLPRPSVVFMAGLLHDVGKGWPKGDHSTRGAKIAATVGARFEAAGLSSWTAEDTTDLIWLVLEHLKMSDISQRRDVSDHDLLRAFAAGVRTVERLQMLYVLTFADMKGTSPKVWSDWKASLLRELYLNTRQLLMESTIGAADGQHLLSKRRASALSTVLEAARRAGRTEISEAVVEAFVQSVSMRYLLSFTPKVMLRHLLLWREAQSSKRLHTLVQHHRKEKLSEFTVICGDRPGLLSLLAGVISANHLEIQSALIFSMNELALDVLLVRDLSGALCDDPERWARVREDLRAVVEEGHDLEALIQARAPGSGLDARLQPPVPTKVVINNTHSRGETVIDVFCLDHPGALYTISKALADAGLTISLAKISTQGGRVADGFYVTDAQTEEKVQSAERFTAIRTGLRTAISKRLSEQ